jgi:hypothetical protein
MAAVSLFGKTKTPPPVGQWGSRNLVQSEPNRRAAKQRVRKQQVQIQWAIHGGKVVKGRERVKPFDGLENILARRRVGEHSLAVPGRLPR